MPSLRQSAQLRVGKAIYLEGRCQLRRDETDRELPQNWKENEKSQVYHEGSSCLHRLPKQEQDELGYFAFDIQNLYRVVTRGGTLYGEMDRCRESQG